MANVLQQLLAMFRRLLLWLLQLRLNAVSKNRINAMRSVKERKSHLYKAKPKEKTQKSAD